VKARHYRYDEALANLFMVEPTAFVRRTAARALGTADKGLVELVVRDGLQEDVPETVYLIEAADYDAISWLAHEEKSESAPGLLARCRQIESDTAYIREAELLSILSKAVVPDSDPELRASLEDWYLNERERAAGPGLRRIPDRILRRAVSLLSPLEKGGLGTFDELALIPSTENSRSARRKTLSQTPIGQHPASVGQPGS
jgi:hypothetical protein